LSFSLLPQIRAQYFDDNGNPLSGGKLYSYIAGSTTPIDTFTDATGSTTNTNPIILDARGEADVWISSSVVYKLVLTSADDVEIYSVDNVRSQGGSGGGVSTDELVKISVIDTQAGYLVDKLVGSDQINLSTLNAGGVEQLKIELAELLASDISNDSNVAGVNVSDALNTLLDGLNNISFPVTSVNGDVGAVVLDSGDVDDVSSVGGLTIADSLNLLQDQLNALIVSASNLGTGEGVFAQEVAGDLQFKSIKAGSNVALSSDGDAITIDASGTTAGVFLKVFLTADLDPVNSPWYMLGSTSGTIASAIQTTASLNAGQSEVYTEKYISGEFLTDGLIQGGFYQMQLIVSSNKDGVYQYDAQFELVEADGTTLVTTLENLSSGAKSLTSGTLTAFQLSSTLPASVPQFATNRISVTITATKISGGGGSTLSVYSGTAYESYFNVPVAVTTDGVTDTRTGGTLTSTLSPASQTTKWPLLFVDENGLMRPFDNNYGPSFQWDGDNSRFLLDGAQLDVEDVPIELLGSAYLGLDDGTNNGFFGFTAGTSLDLQSTNVPINLISTTINLNSTDVNVTNRLNVTGITSITSNDEMLELGDSSFVDKYFSIRPDNSGGINIGLDSSLNAGGIGTGSLLLQTGSSKGFAIKTNLDATTFGTTAPDFEVDMNGDAHLNGDLGVGGDVNVVGDVRIDNPAGDPFLLLGTIAQEWVARIDQSDNEKFQIRDSTNGVNRISIQPFGDLTLEGNIVVTNNLDVTGLSLLRGDAQMPSLNPRFQFRDSDTLTDANQIIGGVDFYTNDGSGTGGVGIQASIDAINFGNGSSTGMSFKSSTNGPDNIEEYMLIGGSRINMYHELRMSDDLTCIADGLYNLGNTTNRWARVWSDKATLTDLLHLDDYPTGSTTDGDIWRDGSTLKARLGGVTKTFTLT
jgi:hypothetical protein